MFEWSIKSLALEHSLHLLGSPVVHLECLVDGKRCLALVEDHVLGSLLEHQLRRVVLLSKLEAPRDLKLSFLSQALHPSQTSLQENGVCHCLSWFFLQSEVLLYTEQVNG